MGVGVGWPGWCGGVGECARVGGVVWASCSWRVRVFVVSGVCACLLFRALCARRECDWVARALLVLCLMGACGGGGVFGVCGFRVPARAPCLSVR